MRAYPCPCTAAMARARVSSEIEEDEEEVMPANEFSSFKTAVHKDEAVSEEDAEEDVPIFLRNRKF